MLDINGIYAEYAAEGNPAYHPQMMMKALFCAYDRGMNKYSLTRQMGPR
jgi:transposase